MIDVIIQFINNKKISMKRFLSLGILYFLLCAVATPVFAESPASTFGSVNTAAGAATTPTTATWKFINALGFGKAIQGTAMNAQSAIFTSTQYSLESLTCLGIGIGCTDKIQDLPTTICNSTMGKFNEVIAQTFTTPPADTGMWLADTGRTLGFLPKQAMAQGIGFSGMMPLLPLWKAFRNISYLLMAIVMIALGFMIMFRKKIDPKTVVTAQNAIPKVVIALILITFSYAIVGIMIDIMYVVIYFFIALFKSTGLLDNPGFPACLTNYKTPELMYGSAGLLPNLMNLSWDPLKILGFNNSGSVNTGQFSTILSMIGIPAVIGLSAAPIAAGAAGIAFLTLPLLHLILTIAVIYLFIRLLFFFMTSYIQIIVSLLIAPLQLMLEAVPGSTAFSSWFSNLVSNLAVFPVGAVMFMLSNVFTHFANDATGGKIWAPPYAPISGSSQQIASIVSLGVLFAIPTVAGSIKEALKAKPPMGMFDTGGAGGSAMQFLSSAYYLKMLAPSQLMDRITGKPKPEH